MAIETKEMIALRKRRELEDAKEKVRQMKEETSLLNADSAVWSHAEIEQAKREAAAIKADITQNLIAAEVEPMAEDFK